MVRSEIQAQSDANAISWVDLIRENESWLKQVLANRLNSIEEVEDVFQEISLAMINSKTTLDEVDNPAAWLYRVALRQTLMYRRKKGRYRDLLNRKRDRISSDNANSPLVLLMQTERDAAVREVLHHLSDMDREILMLKYSENWTYQQLAEKLGVSRHTIEYRLIKAKRKLRQLLTTPDGEAVV